jgi:cytoskeletal protein RodZ
MALQHMKRPKLFKLLAVSVLSLISFVLLLESFQVRAEGNEPTLTPTETITLTLPPSETPTPTEETQTDELQVEESTLESKSVLLDENAAAVQPAEAPPASTTSKSIFQGTNLCLVGAIVFGVIVVMIMVVYGIIQRIRTA